MLMRWLRRLRVPLAGATHAEVDDELKFHLEKEVEANIAAGLSAEEARRQAAISFGALEFAREACREQRPGHWLESLVQDTRYALRSFRRNPTFTVTVTLTLMLGIGATTAVFSVVDRILFRSLPYQDAGRLVSVGLTAPIEPQEFMLGGSYYEWRDHQRPFTALTSETDVQPCDLTEEKPERLSCAGVEGNFLATLGVRPIIGRSFTAEEDTPGGPKVALISYALWSSRFGLDPSVLNKMIHLDGHPVRIVGVTPANFQMPRLQPADVVLPQALDVAAQRHADPGRPMWAYARLKPGVSVEQARAQLEPLFEYSLRLAPAPFRKEVHLQVRSLRDRQLHDVRPTAWVLLGLVMAVLLIACANVTSLLLARGASRERELAVRAALGASRARLFRQAITESLVLAGVGAAAGCLFAILLLRFFIAMAPEGLLFLSDARIDGRVIVFTLGNALLCAVVFGLAPALRPARAQALGSRTAVTAPHATLRQWLVIAQIAASFVLLIGGALFLRSFHNLQAQRLGIETARVVTASISLGENAYPTAGAQMAFFQELRRRLRFGPGVTALAISDSVPPGGDHHDQVYASISIAGKERPGGGTGGMVTWRSVTPEFFHVLGIPILKGDGFTDSEITSSERFVVLSSSLAARIFPRQDPVGQRLQLAFGAPDNPAYTVVGVAADVKNGGLAAGDEPEYYRLKRDRAEDWDRAAILIMQSTLPSAVIEKWVRTQVASLDPTVPVEIESLSEQVSQLADQPRFETLLLSFFAASGLLMAVIGLYGVISFFVTQRTQEIGVRMALGANGGDILKLILGSGFKLIIPGAMIGLLVAFAASRLLSSLLFGVSPHDALAFLAVTLLLVLVGFIATLVPATSATAVDPAVALRSE